MSEEGMSDEVDNLHVSPLDRHQSQESHAAPTTDRQKEELANDTIRRDEIKQSLEAVSEKESHLMAQLTQAEESKKRLISLLDEASRVEGFLRTKLEAEVERKNGLNLDLAACEESIAEQTEQLRKMKNCSILSKCDARNKGRKICDSEKENYSNELAENSSVQLPQLIAFDLSYVGKLCFAVDIALLCTEWLRIK